jgi:hypothetical protein
VNDGRDLVFQMAEVAISRNLFGRQLISIVVVTKAM